MKEMTKMIDNQLHIYCEANDSYYPKYITIGNEIMTLNTTYWVYVLEGMSDEAIKDAYENASEADEPLYSLSVFYGLARKKFLKSNQPEKYNELRENGLLTHHIVSIDKHAVAMEEHLIQKYAEAENITEELKQQNQMKWVKSMNNIIHRVRTLIQQSFIFE